MSRSNNVDIQNPATHFFRWKGGDGVLGYWEKGEGDNPGREVLVDLPFTFLILEVMSKIGGGRDEGDSYLPYRSNAVKAKELNSSKFVVRSKHGIEAQGSYAEVKTLNGAKFITQLYIAYKGDDGQLQIGSLEFGGAALNAWIDFTQGSRNLYDGGYKIVDKIAKKKGRTDYFAPVFERCTVPEKIDAEAIRLDHDILTPYLQSYLSQSPLDHVNGNGGNGHVDQELIGEDDTWSGPPPTIKEQAKAMAATIDAAKNDNPIKIESSDDDPWG